MALRLKELATEPDDLSLILGTHSAEGENCKLFFDHGTRGTHI